MTNEQAIRRAAEICGWALIHIFDGEDWLQSDYCHLSGVPMQQILLQGLEEPRFKGSRDALALQLWRKWYGLENKSLGLCSSALALYDNTIALIHIMVEDFK